MAGYSVIAMCPAQMSLWAVVIIPVIFYNSYVATMETGLCIRGKNGQAVKVVALPPLMSDNKYFCCPGFRASIYYSFKRFCVRIPTCQPDCGKGVCIAKNRCKCPTNYTLGNKTCVPICSNPCVNSNCIAPNTCECFDGFKKLSNNRCEPQCSNGCANGICLSPENCICNEKWSFSNDTGKCQPICKMQCINGTCIAPDQCECMVGYQKANGSNNICELRCINNCLNGTCLSSGICRCNTGWRLSNINSTNDQCVPICNNLCINATCIAPDTCECIPGHKKAADSEHICEPYCASDCSDRSCVSPDTCICDLGWYWNNETKTCNIDELSTSTRVKDWFVPNWQYVVAAIVLLAVVITITVLYQKFFKKKNSQYDVDSTVAVSAQDIRMNIFKRAKVHI